jgi:hypothetical protein
MLQRMYGIGALSFALALASHSRVARAEGSEGDTGDSKGGSDETKKPASTGRGDTDAKKRTDQRSTNDRRAADRTPLRINEAFTFPVAGGCQYSSTIRGTIKQARISNGDEPRFTPTLVVNAWVTCQNNTELRVTDNTLRETPMSRSELEQAIELRASLLNESVGKRCAYVPDFTFGDNKLASFGVSFLCPADGTEARADNKRPNDNQHTSDSHVAADNRHGDTRGAEGRGGSSESRSGSDKRRKDDSNNASSDQADPSDDGQQ